MLNKIIDEDEQCFIIAEVGVNHNGDIGLAKKLINVTKDAGALEKWGWAK